MRKQKVLFLCTENAARSQMAEGFLRHYASERFEAYSAGVSPAKEIHSGAVEAMEEAGVDISDHYPKGLTTYMGRMGFNYLVIVCARAEANCPKTFPGVGTRLIWAFDDPRAEEDLPTEESLRRFRHVRDEIQLKVRQFLDNPDAELEKLRRQREREHRERMAESET